ncbi:MAG: hypothetical protein ACKVPX_06430 [Myxococcaceae bacterium]
MNDLPFRWRDLVANNGFLLSAAYLGVGVVAETLYRIHPTPTLVRALFALEQTPGQVLAFVGGLEPLRRGYVYGQLPGFAVRVVFGLAMVVVIFLTAGLMAGVMNGLRGLYLRFRGL